MANADFSNAFGNQWRSKFVLNYCYNFKDKPGLNFLKSYYFYLYNRLDTRLEMIKNGNKV